MAQLPKKAGLPGLVHPKIERLFSNDGAKSM
jgi:hypothetical protein